MIDELQHRLNIYTTVDSEWVVFNVIFIAISLICLGTALLTLLGCCPTCCVCICRPKSNSRWINVSGTILISIIVACFSYYCWFTVVARLDDQHGQMIATYEKSQKLRDIIINGYSETVSCNNTDPNCKENKTWKGLKYLKGNIQSV